jgi:hypothetical protein
MKRKMSFPMFKPMTLMSCSTSKHRWHFQIRTTNDSEPLVENKKLHFFLYYFLRVQSICLNTSTDFEKRFEEAGTPSIAATEEMDAESDINLR